MTQVIPTEQLSVSVASSIASQIPAEATCLSEQVWIAFSADVNTMTADALLGAIGQQLMQGKSDLHLMLSTPGGTVSAGLSIYNRLRALPIRITTYNVGQVASIGNVIFQSGSRRFASPT